ncbi:unnamed protein product [Arctogadus glacialis]
MNLGENEHILIITNRVKVYWANPTGRQILQKTLLIGIIKCGQITQDDMSFVLSFTLLDRAPEILLLSREEGYHSL